MPGTVWLWTYRFVKSLFTPLSLLNFVCDEYLVTVAASKVQSKVGSVQYRYKRILCVNTGDCAS